MAKYKKDFLDISKQVELLRSRGLVIENENDLKFYLKYINYYHLSAYFKTFQDKNDRFRDGASFGDILNVYKFDKKLRLLLLDVLEKIEMSFKSVLSHNFSEEKKDIYWYLPEKNNYRDVLEKVERIIEKTKDSKEVYIQHFFKKYNEEMNLPAWIFFEGLTFGDCSLIARNLSDADKEIVASFYRLPKRTSIQMLHHLSLLRNLCAHHAWVWNRCFTFKTSIYKKYKNVFLDVRDDLLFVLIISAQIFIKKVSPTSDWLDKLEDLINEHGIEADRMGFPVGWKEKLKSISK